MRHLGHICILAYCAAALVFQYWWAMAASQGIRESGPWLLAMAAAVLFGFAAAFKLFRGILATMAQGSDEVDVAEFDFPDTWLFGLFTIFIAANLIAHGVLAAMADVAGSIWFGSWFIADLLVTLLSFIVWKVAAKRALQARMGQSQSPRRVA